MFIPEFWCGVIATIFVEIMVVIFIGIMSVNSKGKGGSDEKNNS